MSLRVWLPLNGDLHNQGLSSLTVTNNGTTVNNNGKIGKCYGFNGSNQKITGTFSSSISSAIGSLACWVKFNSLPSSSAWFNLMQLGATGGFVACRLGMYVEYGTGINISINGSSTGANYKAYSFSTGTWYHICAVYDGTKVKLYINGSEQLNKTASVGSYTTAANMLFIGGTSNYYLNGYVNDCRYYDHALSELEVKELARGLVLHYPLCDNLNILDNCYSYPTFDTSSSGGGWSHWGPSGHAGTYSQNTDKQYIYNKANTYSHCVNNTASATGKYYICYQSPDFAGGYRSLQFIVKEANGLPITKTICYPTWNARNGGAPNDEWTRIINLGDGFYLCQVDGLSQNGSNDLVSILVQPGYKIYVSEGYLENNREICSNILNQSNLSIIYDISGYCNNGTIVNSLTTIASSPKFNYATHFNGSAYIHTTSPCAEVKTLSLWAKWDTIPSGQSVVFLDAKSHIGLGLMSTGILCITSGLGSGNTFSKASLVANTWYHFVVVNPGGTTDIPRKLYINGIEQTATSSTSNWTYSIDQTQIGKRSTTSDGFVGSLSDVRMYAAALSAEDVLDLYNNSVLANE